MRSLRIGSFALAVAAGIQGVLTAQVMPGPTWSTYYDTGSSVHPDEMPNWRGIEVLSNGNVVVCGYRYDASIWPPASSEGFVACFEPTATGANQLRWTTVFGVTGHTEVTGLCVLPNGDIAISGITDCPSLPVTPACAQPSIGGGFDAFFAVLAWSTGAIQHCTYLGGPNDERGVDVVVPSTGDLVIAGYGDGAVPFGSGLTCPSYQSTPGGGFDAFLAVYDSALTTIRAATYFGLGDDDTASCLTLDGDRPVLGGMTVGGTPQPAGIATTATAYRPTFLGVAGTSDGFLARFDACLSMLEYSTHLGGAGEDFLQAVEVVSPGEYAVGGWTSVFLGQAGNWYALGPFDAFAITLDTGLSGNAQETWLTVFGSQGSDGIWDLAIDSAGMVTSVGGANAAGLPVTSGCCQPAFVTSFGDSFVARLDPQRRTPASGNGERIYVTYFGGTGNDTAMGVALDAQGDAVFYGHTSGGMNSKMTSGCYQPSFVGPIWDLFVADLPLLPLGITRVSGAPACTEVVVAGVNSMPAPGNPGFTLFATGIPQGALGGLTFGTLAPAPIPIPGLNVCVLVAPSFGAVLTPNVAQSLVTLPVPITPPLVPPFGIATQWGFLDPVTWQAGASPPLVF